MSERSHVSLWNSPKGQNIWTLKRCIKCTNWQTNLINISSARQTHKHTHSRVANVWCHRSDTVDLLTPSHYPIRALSSSVTDSVWNCHSSKARGGCLPSLLLQGRCDWAIAVIGSAYYLTGSWLQMKVKCLGQWLMGQRKDVDWGLICLLL